MSDIKSAQGTLGVPVSGEWDAVTEGAVVAYQGSGDGFLPMDASAHVSPAALINIGYYNPLQELPSEQGDYLRGGERPSTVVRDLSSALNQIPRWGWAVGCVGFSALAYSSYKSRKRKKPVGTHGSD